MVHLFEAEVFYDVRDIILNGMVVLVLLLVLLLYILQVTTTNNKTASNKIREVLNEK